MAHARYECQVLLKGDFESVGCRFESCPGRQKEGWAGHDQARPFCIENPKGHVRS